MNKSMLKAASVDGMMIVSTGIFHPISGSNAGQLARQDIYHINWTGTEGAEHARIYTPSLNAIPCILNKRNDRKQEITDGRNQQGRLFHQ
jgi:hypothetical protein